MIELDDIRRRTARVHPDWLKSTLPDTERPSQNSLLDALRDRAELLRRYDDLVVENWNLREELAQLKAKRPQISC